jgi:hypothetical protein
MKISYGFFQTNNISRCLTEDSLDLRRLYPFGDHRLRSFSLIIADPLEQLAQQEQQEQQELQGQQELSDHKEQLEQPEQQENKERPELQEKQGLPG